MTTQLNYKTWNEAEYELLGDDYSLPSDLRDFVILSDNYTVDDDGNVYDPYYEEYPSEEQIREQMEYQREKVD
jgi:hypothetical protein